MAKTEFLKKWHTDYDFRIQAIGKGIRVIQDNVLFFDKDGKLKYVAGKHVN